MRLGSVLRTRRLDCWIESFIDATSGLPSPEIFRKWSAISAVGGALERRVWTSSSLSMVYANLFVLLVAPPGVGKTLAIRPIEELWNKTRKLHVAPDDITKAALIDALSMCKSVHVYGPTDMLEYHSMQVAADELGVLIPSHDMAFMSTMNKFYDNVNSFKESRRGRDEDLIIHNPQINLLAGTQPDFLATFLPPEAWGMGFMSRIIMIYSGKKLKTDLFKRKLKLDTSALLDDMKVLTELHGEMFWTPEAEAMLETWYEAGLPPEPEHTKLKHYVPRRVMSVLKLSMISSAARSNELVVDESDVERARDWLVEAETLMPEIFKEMSGNSDGQLIQELHWYLWEIWTKAEKKGFIHRARIETYLAARTPAYNVENIVKVCVRAGVIVDKGNDLFLPGTKNSNGEFG